MAVSSAASTTLPVVFLSGDAMTLPILLTGNDDTLGRGDHAIGARPRLLGIYHTLAVPKTPGLHSGQFAAVHTLLYAQGLPMLARFNTWRSSVSTRRDAEQEQS